MSRARDLANSADNDISGTLTVDDITLSGNITVGGTVDGRDLATDGAKLDGVEANATADQTGAEIKAAYEGEADTNAYTDAEKTKLSGVEAGADVTDVTNVTAAGALMESAVTNLAQVKAFDSSDYATAAQGATADAALPKSGGTMTGSVSFAAGQTFDGRDLSVDGSKLDGIESGATADQSAAEIKTAYESNSNTNAYTDAEKTKLSGIETGATADQTKADIDALNIDADTLDGQHGSYYTSYADTAVANLVDSAPGTLDTLNELAAALGDDPNFSTTVTNNIATKLPLAGGTMTGAITFASGQTFDGRDVSADGAKLDGIEANAKNDQTITAGSGLTGGGTGDVTISHADTSSVSSSNNSGNTFIQDLTFDGYGHVTAVGTGTVSVGNGTLTVQGTGALGGSGTFTANQSANTTISISHDDTSSQSSVNNSGATVIQDVTLDGYGHVTGLGSKTMTLADLGYTGATNANYITNNNQLTNGAGYTTFTANQSLNTTSSPTFSNPNLTSALRMGGTQVLSSGRALTNISSIDATTAAAIGAGGVGGGGEQTFTAASAVSTGDVIGMRSDGKVQSMESLDTAGSAEETSNLDGIYMGSSYESQYSKMIFNHDGTRVLWLAAVQTTSSYYGNAGYYVNGGTVAANGTITWGTRNHLYQISGTPGYAAVIRYLPTDNNTWIVSIHNSAVSGSQLKTWAIQVSSSGALTIGTPYSIASWNAYGSMMDVFPTGQVIITYNSTAPATFYRALSVSGTTLTAGTQYTMSTNTYIAGQLCVNQNTGKFAIMNQVSSGKEIRVGTVSGTTLSSTNTVLSGSHGASTMGMTWLNDTDFWHGNSNTIYRINGSNVASQLRTGATISGLSGVHSDYGYPTRYGLNWDDYSLYSLVFNTNTYTHVVYKATYNGDGTFSIVFNPIDLNLGFDTANLSYWRTSFSGGKAAMGQMWFDSTYNSTRADVVIFNAGEFVNTSYVGIAKENISANSTGKIAVSGGTAGGQTGLTAGVTYGINLSSGTIYETLDDAQAIAISSTEVLLY